MNEWWLISVFFMVMVFTVAVLIYPIRQTRKLCGIACIVILIASCCAYYCWGGFVQWRDYLRNNQSQALATQMLRSFKSPQELIDKLRAKLDDTPESAKGWYLLGRLYLSQNNQQQAFAAFEKAYQFKPENEQFAVNYAHSLWQKNKQQFTPELITIFKTLLAKNPEQPDALAMLAMNAYLQHANREAIDYWQRLLKLAPAQSEEALAIRKAIANAEEQI